MKALLIVLAVGLSATGCSVGGGPVQPREAACAGLSPDICTQVVGAMAAVDASEVSGFRVHCTASSCSQEAGSLEINVVRSDGTRTSSDLSWANGFNAGEARTVFRLARLPIPTPPVPPTCDGVPVDVCEANWMTAMESVPSDLIDQVIRVIVECTSPPCTTTSGSGRVMLWFRDGTSRVESAWDNNQRP